MLDFDFIISKIIPYSRRVVKKVKMIILWRIDLENQAETHDRNKEYNIHLLIISILRFLFRKSVFRHIKTFLFIFLTQTIKKNNRWVTIYNLMNNQI